MIDVFAKGPRVELPTVCPHGRSACAIRAVYLRAGGL